MAETAQLFQLLQNKMEEQWKQMEEGRKQTEALIAAYIEQTGQQELEQPSPQAPLVVIPSFDPFDPTTELWNDYWVRFQTFVGAITPLLRTDERSFSSPISRAFSVAAASLSKMALKYLAIPASGEHPTQIYARGKERDCPIGSCSRCGKSDHRSPDCPFRVPLSVLPEAWPFGSSLFEPVRPISKYQIGTVKATETVPRLQQSVLIQGKQFMFEVDTGTGDNFCSEDVWCDLEKPPRHLQQDGLNFDNDSSIEEFPTPETKRQVRGFLGLAEYYRRLIPDYSSIVAPINRLASPDRPGLPLCIYRIHRQLHAKINSAGLTC
ncbi:hypothetical protein EMCRGX_G017698 [Ephydatia muelleri]